MIYLALSSIQSVDSINTTPAGVVLFSVLLSPYYSLRSFSGSAMVPFPCLLLDETGNNILYQPLFADKFRLRGG